MLNCCTSKIYKRKEKKRNPLLPVSDFIISILIFDLLPLNVIITTNFTVAYTIIKWEERALPRRRGTVRAADETWQETARQSQVTKPIMTQIFGSHSSSVWPEGQPAGRLAFIL